MLGTQLKALALREGLLPFNRNAALRCGLNVLFRSLVEFLLAILRAKRVFPPGKLWLILATFFVHFHSPDRIRCHSSSSVDNFPVVAPFARTLPFSRPSQGTGL